MISSGDIKVLVSYAHESGILGHMDRALAFTQSLRGRGIDADIDQFHAETGMNWPTWMRKRIQEVDFVICLASPLYRERVEGEGDPSQGLGARWEGVIITEEIYAESITGDSKYIAVVLEGCNSGDIPSMLQPLGRTHYHYPADDESLYRRITGQPRVLPMPLGPVVKLSTT